MRLRALLLVASVFAIGLRAQPVTITSPSSLPNGTINIPYPATGFAATPSATYNWSATGLPTGMSIDPNSGMLSGTPTVSGSFSVMVTASDSADETSGSRTYPLTINLAITDPTPLPKGNVGSTYSYSFGTSPVSGGTPPFTWSQTGGGLPPGLQLNSGVLSGTPTKTGLYGFTITVTDAAGATGSKNFGMIVGTLPIVVTVIQSPPASSLTIPYPPPGAPAQPYFSAANGTGTYSWSASGLPLGIVIANPSTPILSGTPTQSGTFSVTVQAADAQGGANSVVVSLVINPAPSVTTSSLADCTGGTSCSRSLSATGGTLPITWHITSGSVPAGMSLTGSVISGPPNSVSVPTTSSFTVTATDAVGASGSQALFIRVNPAVAITTGSPLPATTSGQSYSQTIAATGGSGTLAWTGSGLPAWLSISTSGVLSGTAPAVVSATAYPFSLQAADTNGSSASKNFSVTVNPVPTISPSTLMPWTAGQPYSVQLVPVGGTPSFTFSDAGVPSALPSWLELSGSTLSGTPPLPGGTAYAFTIRVTDSTGANSTQAYSLQINQPPTVTTTSLPPATSGASYTQPLNASNGTSPLTWSGLSLPSWLTVSGASLTGTAPVVTTFTNYPFSVKVTDAAGASNTSPLSVTVNPIPVILTVTPNTGQQGQSITSVAVVGQGTNFVNGTSVANFGAGITVNSTTVTDATHATVNITIAAGIATGARTVTMTTGNEVATLVNGFTVVASGTPEILSVAPNTGHEGQSIASVAVVGLSTNFVNGTTVANLGAGITVNSTTVTDATHATVSITIAAGAAVGARTVTMTTASEVATLSNGFTVVALGTPAILSVTPNSGQQGQTLASVAVVGQFTNFVNGTSVASFGAGITVNSTTVTDATHATVSITMAAGAAVGARTVTMTTGSEVATLSNGFTVVALGTPAILSVTPNSGQQGQTLASVAVVGQFTNFVNGTSVASFGAGITVNSTTVTDATHATVSITIAAGAAVGARTVTMTTGGEVATLSDGFTAVALGTPAILSVTPNSGQQGQTLASVAVVGQFTNFVNGTSVANFGAGITVNSTTVTDATHATVSITITAGIATGARTVTMTTGGEVASLVNGFTVLAAGTPQILTVTPNTGQQGQSITSVSVVGLSTNFVNGTTVANFGAGITVSSTTVTDATHATVSITIAAGSATGARTVTMTTGGEVATLVNGFTVVAAGTPLILTVTPNTGQQGQSIASVVVVGQATNFVNGTTVASFGAGITVNSTTVSDATHATAGITIAAGIATGARTVTMTTGGEVATLVNGFTVVAAGTPLILTVTPNTGQQGQSIASVAVVGLSTNFVNGTSVASFGAGITVNSTTVTDATHATVSITIAAGIATGARTVTMTTGSEVATLVNGFTVVAAGTPLILTVTPNTGQQGQSIASVVVVGQATNFVNGTTVASFGAGITVNSTTVSDATHATASITIAAGIATGARTVTMTTGGEVATLVNGFTVVAAGTPLILTVTPNTGQQGQSIASVAVVGLSTNFVNGTTVANFGAGITVNSTTVTDATHATVSITIAAGIATGARTVTMTTGGEVAALVNGFAVVASGSPQILTVTPNTGQQGQSIASVSVVGLSTNFVNEATVASFGAGITVNSTTVTDAAHATVSITIAAGVAVGARTVTMTTGTEVATLVNGFAVVASGTPLLLTVAPNTGQQGQNLASVGVVGLSTNFVNGTTVASFGPGITVNSTTVTDATHATVAITIASNAAAGARTVTMTTGSEAATLANGFTVLASGTPLLLTVTPNTGQQGQSIASVVVVGHATNFLNGKTVASFGAGITVNSTTVTDATHAKVSVTIAANTATGARSVILTTGNEVATLSKGFTVVASGTPLILTVTPNTGQQSQTLASVGVVGLSTNFVNGTTVANFGPGITVNSTTVTDAAHATVSIMIAANATPGARTVTMTTGNEVAALSNGFTVAPGTPVIQSVTPNTGQLGQSFASVSVVGKATNFVNGTTVADFGADITVNSTTVTDATHATVSITIAANAANGPRTVTLITGGEVATLAVGFTVTTHTDIPVILTVTPNTARPGEVLTNVAVVGLGTNFINGTTVASFGAGVTVNSTTVTDATHATVSLTIATSATPGPRTVTLVTGSEVASQFFGFAVTFAGVTPIIQSLTPDTGLQGQSFASVAVVGLGTNFVDGTTVAGFGAGVTVNSTSVTDATHAAVSITIAADTPSGVRPVTMTTGSEVAVSASGFTVTVNTGTPAILTVTPNMGQQEQTLADVQVVGQFTNFVNGRTLADFGPGITVNATTVTDAAHATVSITISPGAVPGVRAVTLTTGFEVATTAAGFLVDPAVTITNPNTLQPWTEGQPYSVELAATGGTNPYTFSDPTASLPGWLVLKGSTLSGTPPAPGGTVYSFNLQAADEVGAITTKAFTVLINKPPVVGPTTLPSTTSGLSYSALLTTLGGTAPFTWSATGLPPWLGLTGGSVNGIAPAVTTVTTFSFAVTVTDFAGATAQGTFSGTLNPPVSIVTPSALPSATSGGNYSQALIATGGTAPLTFSIVSGTLPSGLTLGPDGLLFGVPASVTQPTNFQIQVLVTDSLSSSDSRTFVLLVVPQPLTISTSALSSGTAGVAYSVNLEATGGVPPYTWALAVGVLPTGIQLDPTTGLLSGKPTEGGSFPLTFSLTDKLGTQVTRAFTLIIASNLKIATPPQLTEGSAGAGYSLTFQTTGASGSVTWSTTQGLLPGGMSLDPTSGTLSGIPAQVGTFNARVRAQDATGLGASEAIILVIDPASIPAVTIGGLNNSVQPDQQLPIALSLSSSFPLDITGQLTVTFTPNPSVGVFDPTVQFGGGGTSVTFRIPANTTQAIFDQVSTLQTGSLAGTISVGATFQSGGAAASPTSLVGTSGAVPPLPPMIVGTPTAKVTSSSIQISLTGLANTRQVTSATYVFSFTAASHQAPVTVTVPLTNLVSAWYATPASLGFGSLFGFTETFTVNGDVSQVASVSITIANDQGTSQAASVSF